MKRKGSICSFFSPKRKATKVNEQLSKIDGGDEVEGEREGGEGEKGDKDEVEGERKEVEGEREHEDEVEGEKEGQQKPDRDRIQGRGDQGQEEVGEHHSGENMKEGESDRLDNVLGSDSERERRVPEPSPTSSSRAGPHGMEIIAA